MRRKDLVQVQMISGQSVTGESITLTPQSQALIVRLPIGAGLWNRPTSMLVEWDGTGKHVSIVDLIRRSQLRLVGLSVVVITRVSFVRFARRKEKIS